jgi:glucose-1-phosphate thymidylyltransferase
MMIACPEEIAYERGYITKEDIQQLAKQMGDTDYRAYLLRLIQAI